jgi:hypothetical protein
VRVHTTDTYITATRMASKGLRVASEGSTAQGRGRGAHTVTDTRLTLRQAAAALGLSESAIRKRVERGTLRSDKGADGRRYVYVDTVTENVADEGGEDRSVTREHDALISELRAHNDTLREQLEAERQGHAEARRLLLEALAKIPPAIEAPPDERESPETAREKVERAEQQPRPTTVESQESVQRPWWRRVFGR